MAGRKKLKARVVKVKAYRATRYKRNPAELYDELVAAGCEIDSHESDLYVRDTPTARAILKRHGVSFTTFRSNIAPHVMWLDVPFHYAPFWRGRERRARGNPSRRERFAGIKPSEWLDLDAAERGSWQTDADILDELTRGEADETVGGLDEAGWYADLFLDVPVRRRGRRALVSFILYHDESNNRELKAYGAKAVVMRRWRDLEREAAVDMADAACEACGGTGLRGGGMGWRDQRACEVCGGTGVSHGE